MHLLPRPPAAPQPLRTGIHVHVSHASGPVRARRVGRGVRGERGEVRCTDEGGADLRAEMRYVPRRIGLAGAVAMGGAGAEVEAGVVDAEKGKGRARAFGDTPVEEAAIVAAVPVRRVAW
jgi:hypothetical protein